jgi:methylmalonyl-CoA mutase
MTTPSQLTLDEFPPTDSAAWRAAAEASLKGAPFDRKLLTRTHEGITLQPIYTAADLDQLALPEAWPGLPPYGRGGSPLPRPPLVAQEIPLGIPSEFRAAALSDLMRGQDALAIQLDVAGRRGLDPSEAETGEVATCGLSLACLEDARAAFDGIEPSAITLIVWAGATALPMLGLFASHSMHWRGAVVGDPLGEYVRDGFLPLALDDAYTEMAACVRWAASTGRDLRSIGVGCGLWADAGGSAVEELGFGLATAVEYLRELERHGIPPAQASAQVLFSASLGSHVLMQAAKLRALRLLWSRAQSAIGIAPATAFLHARSSVFNKSVLDPHTNMLRASAEALSGVLGGADSMHVAAFDEPLRTPDEFSRRIARNVHAILHEECHLAATTDPAAGSWFVESVTIELARKAWELFQEVETRGGMAAALRHGWPQERTEAVAAKRREAAATRRDGYIGVNLFPNPAEHPLDAARDASQTQHAGRAAAIEALRPHSLPKIERSVEGVASAFAGGATLGQIREALPRSAPCEPAIPRLRVCRVGEGFEALRAAASLHARHHGHAPTAWLANFGPKKQHGARAGFSSGFLAVGGFEVNQGSGAETPEEAARAAAESKAPLVVMCSTDETYPDLVAPFITDLRTRRPKVCIYLAGYPEQHITAFREAGVDGFLHLRANCLETLQDLHESLGIGH